MMPKKEAKFRPPDLKRCIVVSARATVTRRHVHRLHRVVLLTRYFLYYIFYRLSILYVISRFHFPFSLPRRYSDPGSLSRLFSPPPHYDTRLHFYREKIPPAVNVDPGTIYHSEELPTGILLDAHTPRSNRDSVSIAVGNDFKTGHIRRIQDYRTPSHRRKTLLFIRSGNKLCRSCSDAVDRNPLKTNAGSRW